MSVQTAARFADIPPDAPRTGGGGRRWWLIGIVVLAVGAALLTIWSVWSSSRSDYYASIALSMSQNWSNFFFGAIDPAGTVTLDKIPGSFWIPALFVKVFGFSTWAVVLPNALAAVGATLLSAFTAKRLLGPTAGLLTGAFVATTPILIAVARSNQPETFFVLGLAAVAWAASKALTGRSFGWLVVAGLFVALSFQTYMLEAWAVWPALAAAWLCTKQAWGRKLWTLTIAGVVSAAASVTWIAIVSLVPSDARPYVGSTLTNSAWEMVFGYNGLGRFGDTTADTAAYRSFTPPFSGSPSAFRLFNEQLAGQIAWLLPTALLAIVVLWVLKFSRPVTVLVTVWFVTFAVMFSVVAGMHQFYTAALSVPTALAVGLAFAHARARGVAWAQVALIAVAAVSALAIGVSYGGYSVPVSLVQMTIAAAAIALIVGEKRRGAARRGVVAVLAGAAMLLTPLAWSVVTIANPSAINPVAGGVADMGFAGGGGLAVGRQGGGGSADGGFTGSPGAGTGAGDGSGVQPGQGRSGLPSGQSPRGGQRASGGAGAGTGTSTDTSLIAYLEANRGSATYLAATFGAQSAAGYIIASDGGSFLPVGGFNGEDPVPTLARFQALVADGELRYVIVAGTGGPGGTPDAGEGVAAQIMAWVKQNCTQPSGAPSTQLWECTAS